MRAGAARWLVGAALLLSACADGPTAPPTARIDLVVSGLPAGTTAALDVTGPRDFRTTVTASGQLKGLVPGLYTITPRVARAATGDLYAPSPFATQTLQVAAGRPVQLSIAHVLYSGSVAFLVTGLPDGLAATARLTHGTAEPREVAIPATLRGLEPGEWTVAYAPATNAAGHRFAADSTRLMITPSLATALEPVVFTQRTGTLRMAFNGLPTGAVGSAFLDGPLTNRVVVSNELPRVVAPGLWSAEPRTVVAGGITYGARTVQASVPVGSVATVLRVDYTAESARLIVRATGLPSGTPRITVSNASGFLRDVAPGDTLSALAVGTYRVRGDTLTIGDEVYRAPEVSVDLDGGTTEEVTLAYAAAPVFNARVDFAYAVQTTQRRDGSVPLVAERDALLRVFATANASNTHRVPMHVRIRQGTTTVFEQRIDANADGIPTAVNEGTALRSWQVAVPGTHLRPGAVVDVELDPDSTLGERNRGDNVLVRPLVIRQVAPFRVRLVPVRFAAEETAANVTPATLEAYLQLTREMLPLQTTDADIRTAYVTNQPPLVSNTFETWSNVLSELDALRVAESGDRYYAGFVRVGYTSGIAGLAYLGRPTSLTWDYLPSGSEVLAHELGHNFDRSHAPGCGPDGVDPAYPHANGTLGAFGWHARLSRIRRPSDYDIMSYCSDPWISDYTWEEILQYRADEAAAAGVRVEEPALLVWGSVGPSGITLEPAFEVDAAPVLPTGGPLRLELRTADGRSLYAANFRAAAIPHATPAGTAHFTFAIPRRLLAAGTVASLRVLRGAQAVERRITSDPALRVAPSVQAVRNPDGRLRLTHGDAATVGMIIRDASTGRILSIVRGREAVLPLGGAAIDVLASDGIRTTTLRITPPTR